ncbi:MAG: dephospho-CoA kinase [Flavobacteriales bacterium]|nr:dephospho-CoA kinase [Flavobacteriales bacterium]|tara:strand:+ start:1628 stop:2203 length:576 start_codon:yes stop_codon:yes gene_type:complete
MKKIGITGGIGSGKTYVSEVFSSLGIPVFNADVESKRLMSSSDNLISLVKDLFGDDIYTNGLLDKQKLASIVFSDKEKLENLNNIIHPVVKQEFIDWCKQQNSSYVIKETAILFESRSDKGLDAVICVSAPLNIRIDRAVKRDGYSEKEIKNRIENQISQEEKENLSDYIIVNDEKDLLLPQIIKIHQLFS